MWSIYLNLNPKHGTSFQFPITFNQLIMLLMNIIVASLEIVLAIITSLKVVVSATENICKDILKELKNKTLNTKRIVFYFKGEGSHLVVTLKH